MIHSNCSHKEIMNHIHVHQEQENVEKYGNVNKFLKENEDYI